MASPLANLVARISEHPILFIFFRSLLENDFKSIRGLIRRNLRLGPGVRTLDLGCGPGAFADLFVAQDYVGVDLNRRYIDHARTHRKGAFIAGDARRLDLPGGRFDQALILGLLHHLDDEDARAVLREAKRVLVPGGVTLVIEDVPTINRLNLIGHLLHRIENGAHIRAAEAYDALYREFGRIEKSEVLRSGICDYHAALLVT
jgi:ubiquinone/menaquinone biosynthesis C-methylase UbiE